MVGGGEREVDWKGRKGVSGEEQGGRVEEEERETKGGGREGRQGDNFQQPMAKKILTCKSLLQCNLLRQTYTGLPTSFPPTTGSQASKLQRQCSPSYSLYGVVNGQHMDPLAVFHIRKGRHTATHGNKQQTPIENL